MGRPGSGVTAAKSLRRFRTAARMGTRPGASRVAARRATIEAHGAAIGMTLAADHARMMPATKSSVVGRAAMARPAVFGIGRLGKTDPQAARIDAAAFNVVTTAHLADPRPGQGPGAFGREDPLVPDRSARVDPVRVAQVDQVVLAASGPVVLVDLAVSVQARPEVRVRWDRVRQVREARRGVTAMTRSVDRRHAATAMTLSDGAGRRARVPRRPDASAMATRRKRVRVARDRSASCCTDGTPSLKRCGRAGPFVR